ncbi:SAM-dependent methyltransferase [Paenibacillus sp. FSL H7-0326]|uniref:O-methyltransferase n=1 Tax=Paenibacillus sp. FSL H7-0326 TaxID=1921144 RepID=UPI00096FED26|nr:class I SAM-dependent methyltransferase [Paenibacillus sp. FSL H7-0326]OMC71753.1 SAM-dependent methyltransferase [Paenibacillus sp. FSL H7-0326]
MDELQGIQRPIHAERVSKCAAEYGFTASCDDLTGSFLRMLAANRKQSTILELGTGVGHSTAWLLDGMDQESRLYSVEMDEQCSNIAREVLGDDPRLHLFAQDGGEYIEQHKSEQYDVIFADTWPGKFYLAEEVLDMVKPGGLYIIDDLNPQPNWPEDHEDKVSKLVSYLESREDFHLSKLNWSTGLILMTKKS